MSTIDRRQTNKVNHTGEMIATIGKWSDRIIGSGRLYSFRRRRVVAIGLVGLALGVAAVVVSIVDAALLHRGVMTGWMLMTCLVMLMLIGLRRRIPGIPIGTMSTWTQVHLYTGLFTIGIFVMHTPMLFQGEFVASGYFEGSLSVLFWLVSGSGIYGLVASRRLPARLTSVGEQIRFDQIQWRREQIADRAFREIEELKSSDSVAVLGEFHDRYLSRYFRRRPSTWYLMVPNSVRRRRTIAGLVELNRYLDEEGQTVSGHLAGLVRQRDDLDYQYALQFRLRTWVWVHATASVALIVMAIIHGILAIRFLGS